MVFEIADVTEHRRSNDDDGDRDDDMGDSESTTRSDEDEDEEMMDAEGSDVNPDGAGKAVMEGQILPQTQRWWIG